MKASEIITIGDLRSQGGELLCWRLGHSSGGFQLSLPNGMHDFDTGDRTPGRPKRLKAEHRPHFAFHRAMILLHDIVEILALSDGDGCLVGPVVLRNRRGVAPTLINRELLREPMGPNRVV